MSNRSQRLAGYVRQFKERQPEADKATVIRNEILNNGFAELRDTLKNEFQKQVDELNHEPGCADFLVCKFSGIESGVYRTDENDSHLTVKFDSATRTATITCDKPTKFKYFVEVRLTTNETGFYFAAGEKKNDLSSYCAQNDVSWIVDKALYALVGIEA